MRSTPKSINSLKCLLKIALPIAVKEDIGPARSSVFDQSNTYTHLHYIVLNFCEGLHIKILKKKKKQIHPALLSDSQRLFLIATDGPSA